MKTSIVVLSVLGLFMGYSIKAATLNNIEGITKDGWRIEVWCESSPCTFITMSRSKINERQFENEHCDYTSSIKSGAEHHVLSCSKSGKSPLAGTRYVGHFVLGKCMNLFICKSGCRTNAPKVLKETLYDCD